VPPNVPGERLGGSLAGFESFLGKNTGGDSDTLARWSQLFQKKVGELDPRLYKMESARTLGALGCVILRKGLEKCSGSREN